ncbi:hypothetical protein POL58_30205 [Nannocystis sp. ncelm1]|uniref:Uncharacterized protein n=1 Tax=Nannocystis radixulma TaxID=2995305 RepID=A0ABT5BD45_9BACT|nr:hypothetical protein [Nannocystis radixulma]
MFSAVPNSSAARPPSHTGGSPVDSDVDSLATVVELDVEPLDVVGSSAVVIPVEVASPLDVTVLVVVVVVVVVAPVASDPLDSPVLEQPSASASPIAYLFVAMMPPVMATRGVSVAARNRVHRRA